MPRADEERQRRHHHRTHRRRRTPALVERLRRPLPHALLLALLPLALLLLDTTALASNPPQVPPPPRLNTTLRVLGLGYFSPTPSPTQAWFTGQVKSLAALFPIAIDHFNNRRGLVVPAFAALGNCSVGIDMVTYMNDEGEPTRAMERLVRLAPSDLSAVLGPVTSTVASPVSVTASALQIPIVSNWATSPTLTSSPSFFTRTCPSDDASAMLLAEVLASFGYTIIGMVYVDNDFGTSWRSSFAAACASYDIVVQSAAFVDTTGEALGNSIRIAMTAVAQYKLNVWFCVWGLTDVRPLFFFFSCVPEGAPPWTDPARRRPSTGSRSTPTRSGS